jgi:predicted CXXCH cytochrome family protein
LIGVAATAAVVVAAGIRSRRSGAPVSTSQAAPTSAVTPTFVGSAACAGCHPRETQAWIGSHHQLAMQPASPSTALGAFDRAPTVEGQPASRFWQCEAKLQTRADGPDGALHTYEVAYTFGRWPLQQYLVAFPGGRLQALPTAWDARPSADGGQRWFDLNSGDAIAPGDYLHWTGLAGNWNHMCADCHSTNVRKRWDGRAGAYATTFAEISVGCEACHGPGSMHAASGGRAPLPVALDERRGIAWPRDPKSGQPRRSAPRTSSRELETCARCHARRGLLHEDTAHGQPIGDDYRVALLDDDLYWPDGQVRGEVYEYGSFLQSRMSAEGVTCSDCHDPHRPELRALASPQTVCLQCHSAEAYLTPKHHFHHHESPGASCIACHMPAATFMVVDERHDHSLRVPRPDLSVKLGVPNACTGRCHADRPASWAAHTVERWYGHAPTGHQRFAEALAAAGVGAPAAEAGLTRLASDRSQPGIARATALARLGPVRSPAALRALEDAVTDADDLVRRAAVSALARAAPETRVALAAPRLTDRVRAVRIEAADVLAGVPAELLSGADLNARRLATEELVSAENLNGDQPESHLNLARVRAEQGNLDQAEGELRRALEIDPTFAPATVNLADLYRSEKREPEAETVLRQALTRDRKHQNAPLLHALGLVLVREGRRSEATSLLAAAARAAPDNARYGYVYAVALEGEGRNRDALAELRRVLSKHPDDPDALAAAGTLLHRDGESRLGPGRASR